MVLIKPPEACSTAEVYKRFRLDVSSTADPLALLEKISKNGISQDVCVNDLGMKSSKFTTNDTRITAKFLQWKINNHHMVCIITIKPPAFEVLPPLKRLKQRIVAAGRKKYDALFMSGSGSTIVGVSSPYPPQFLYDEEDYKDVFLSEANSSHAQRTNGTQNHLRQMLLHLQINPATLYSPIMDVVDRLL